jgi:hypothetical protein
MVTGIEIAGLALAAAPLIISAIEHYREGLEPFKIWARYRRELGLLRDVLDMETAKLLNTCEQLLQSIVPQAELHELITHPGGPQWQDPILQDKLKELLAWSYTSFISALGEIKDTLDELHEKFDLKGIEGKVCTAPAALHPLTEWLRAPANLVEVQRQERLGEGLRPFEVLSLG